MATFSPNLGITLLANGEQSNTWGLTANNNMGTLIEQAISGYVIVTYQDADITLALVNGSDSAPGTTASARNMYIECQGVLTTPRNLIVPTNRKLYFVYNNTTGGKSLVIKSSNSGDAGVTIPAGSRALVVFNGTGIVSAINYIPVLQGTFSLTSTLNLANTTSSLAALKFTTPGPLTATPQPGAVEYDGTQLNLTTVSGTRKQVAFTDGSNSSGTWNISISGSAAAASTANSANALASNATTGVLSINTAAPGATSNVTIGNARGTFFDTGTSAGPSWRVQSNNTYNSMVGFAESTQANLWYIGKVYHTSPSYPNGLIIGYGATEGNGTNYVAMTSSGNLVVGPPSTSTALSVAGQAGFTALNVVGGGVGSVAAAFSASPVTISPGAGNSALLITPGGTDAGTVAGISIAPGSGSGYAMSVNSGTGQSVALFLQNNATAGLPCLRMQNSTVPNSTGAGSILYRTGSNATNQGWLAIVLDGTTRYVPYWA